MIKIAGIEEILDILEYHESEFAQAIGDMPMELSFLEDENYRVKVSVRPGDAGKVDDSIFFELDGQMLYILLEVCEDYQD